MGKPGVGGRCRSLRGLHEHGARNLAWHGDEDLWCRVAFETEYRWTLLISSGIEQTSSPRHEHSTAQTLFTRRCPTSGTFPAEGGILIAEGALGGAKEVRRTSAT